MISLTYAYILTYMRLKYALKGRIKYLKYILVWHTNGHHSWRCVLSNFATFFVCQICHHLFIQICHFFTFLCVKFFGTSCLSKFATFYFFVSHFPPPPVYPNFPLFTFCVSNLSPPPVYPYFPLLHYLLPPWEGLKGPDTSAEGTSGHEPKGWVVPSP